MRPSNVIPDLRTEPAPVTPPCGIFSFLRKPYFCCSGSRLGSLGASEAEQALRRWSTLVSKQVSTEIRVISNVIPSVFPKYFECDYECSYELLHGGVGAGKVSTIRAATMVR
jgi:hypothetical protein